MTLSASPIAAAAAVDASSPLDVALVQRSAGWLKEEDANGSEENGEPTAMVIVESEHADNQAAVAAEAQGNTRKSRKHVRFDEADVLEFEPSAWTATVASDGVPVGMSNTLRRRTRRRLDSFESERCLWRVRREEYMEHGYLEPDERLEILENAGHSASVISHVEKETIRINRERWESNEYDLMFQFGLGEVPVLEMSEDEEEEDDDDLLFLAPPDSSDEDCGLLMQLDDDDDDADDGGENDCGNQGEGFYYAMQEMDAYDTRRYEELGVDYEADCILGDSAASDETNELPYAKDSFESPLSFAEMSSSPTDVSVASECMIVSCSTLRASAVSSSTSSAGAKAAGGEPSKMLRI